MILLSNVNKLIVHVGIKQRSCLNNLIEIFNYAAHDNPT